MAFVLPPDWFDNLPLRLMVVLHGEATHGVPVDPAIPRSPLDMDVSVFVDITSKVRELLTWNESNPGVVPTPRQPVDDGADPAEWKPKFAALFPVGLGREDEKFGGWKSGHLAQDSGLMDVDDVAFVLVCIERLAGLLAQRHFEINGTWAEQIFHATRRYVIGTGSGGQLCYKLAAERPGFFQAIVAHSCVPAGFELRFQQDALLDPVFHARPPADVATSVLHVHGATDLVVPYNGADSTHNGEIREHLGVAVGPTDYDRIDLELADSKYGLEALWASGWSLRDAPRVPGTAMLVAADSAQWTPDASGVPPIVRVLVVDAIDHAWPNAVAHGFDLIALAWNFVVGLEDPAAVVPP